MDEIKVIINGEEYTEERFKKDVARMFDTFRDSDCSEYMGSTICEGVDCDDCPLCNCSCSVEDSKDDAFERIKIVYKWAQEHPLQTNADKLTVVFGKNYGALIASKMSQGWQSWLDEEWKDPKKK